MTVYTFIWRHDRLDILDQRLLPHKTTYLPCRTAADVATAIRDMAVRGAPAIGCCAAYGMALAVRSAKSGSRRAKEARKLKSGVRVHGSKRLHPNFIRDARSATRALETAADRLRAARPTAVNLAWAVDRMLAAAREKSNGPDLFSSLVREARRMEAEDGAVNRAIGRYGAALLKSKSAVLTHCNAGSLATAAFGTALGIVREAARQNKIRHVFVDETRPYLQGARLTAWELQRERIPYFLITDNMAAHMMRVEGVDAVIVGCDRVAANGDTANKIGTYGLAVLAKYHRIPFYVAMPTSTLDLSIPTGGEIPIEERSSREVTEIGPVRVAPKGARARHPAFDITPASLITAFVTEKGVVRPPYRRGLPKLVI